jgi:hypothetical protein
MGGGTAFGASDGQPHSYGELQGYEEDWMTKTKDTLEKELKDRGIDPAVIKDVVDKVEEPSIVAPILVAIFATALILTAIFWIVWESTR